MPRKAKPKTDAEVSTASPATAAPEAARGAKTAAIKLILIANPTKSPKAIAALVKEQGFETTAKYIGAMKAKMKLKKKGKAGAAAPAPVAAPAAPASAAAPAAPKDAVSLGLLQKAKKLAAQLGGVKAAQAAIDALSQLID